MRHVTGGVCPNFEPSTVHRQKLLVSTPWAVVCRVIFLTLFVILDTAPVAFSQYLVENRGQWDRRIAFVAAGADVVVYHDGTVLLSDGERIRLDSSSIVARQQQPATLHYYTATGAIEGVRTVAAVEWQRQGKPVARLAWDGTALVFSRVASPERRTLAAVPVAARMQPALHGASWGMGGRFLGGSGRDSIAAMAITSSSILVAGWTDSPSFPGASSGATGRDAFVARLSPDGTLAWATLIGGSSDDAATSVAATTDEVAVAGITGSINFPITAGTVQPSYGGGDTDGFVATLDQSSGTRRAATFIGGDGSDALSAVALNAQRIAVGGRTTSASLPANAHQQQFGGLQDGYIAVLTPQLSSRLWSTYYGGRGFDNISGIGLWSDGSLAVAGTTTSPNTGQAIAAGLGEGSQRAAPPDGFVARLDANGQRLWGRYYGSDGQDSITSLSVTPSGLILLTGMTNGTNTAQSYIATASAAQNQFAGGQWDGFVAVLNPDGTRQWGSYTGGTGSDRCTAAAMDAQGYVLVTGWTDSEDFPLAHSDNTSIAGAEDAFIGFFSPDGTRRIASLLYGGSGSDLPCGIGWAPDSSIVVVGTTTSTSLAPASGSNAGSFDGFLLRLQSLGILSVPSDDDAVPAIETTSGALCITLPPSCLSAELRVYTLGGVLVTCERTLGMQHRLPLPPGVYAVELRCMSAPPLRRVVLIW